MTNKLLALTAVLVMIGLFTQFDGVYSHNLTTTKEPDTVPYVNISRYAGVWYEQAVIPFYFERGCSQTTAHYSLNSDGSIKVNNTCIRNGVFH
jgi:lipocalin